jgi:galactose mutarotase-like enzyme
MTITSIRESAWHNLSAWTLENDAMRVVIVPKLGAKIASIYDKRVKREWLIPPTHTPIRPIPYAASFSDYDMNAWDEMFPTIIPVSYPVDGAYKGRMLPDHGEVWALPWAKESGGPGELVLSVHGIALPYRLERAASLESPSTLRLRYSVTNLGSETMPYLWAAHPLFAVDEQTEIVLPSQVSEVYNVHNRDPWGEHGRCYPWPKATTDDTNNWDLSHIGPAILKDCRKFYVKPELPVGWAGLRQRDTGAWLRLNWDSAKLPYLGIWIDEGTYATVPTVALEPTNGFYDGLTTAYNNQQISQLAPAEFHQWSVNVRLDDGQNEISAS